MNIRTYTKKNGRKCMNNMITFYKKKKKKKDIEETMLGLITF